MWFAFSLFTIIAWGGSDLFSKMGTDPNDQFSHYKLIVAVGFVMGVHAIIYILYSGISYNPMNIIYYFPVSFFYILSMAIGYAGLRYIELSVSSPICNSSGAVAAVLCFIFLGQRMESIQLAAVALICLGIFLLSYFQKKREVSPDNNPKYTKSLIAILFPILYCIIDGFGSFLDAYYLNTWMDEAQANLSYEFTFLIAAILAYSYLKSQKQPYRFKKEKLFGIAALCETAGQFTYIYALADNAIVSAPMISSYSIFSVLLSRIFIKEKLSFKQYAVIAMVIVGIAVLGME